MAGAATGGATAAHRQEGCVRVDVSEDAAREREEWIGSGLTDPRTPTWSVGSDPFGSVGLSPTSLSGLFFFRKYIYLIKERYNKKIQIEIFF
jgi:hypothetical protein